MGARHNVLSIDDDAAFQKQLRLLLLQADIRLLPSAATFEQGIYFAQALKPDIILLDVWLDGRNSLLEIPRLLEVSPKSHIIVLTLYEEQEYRDLAAEHGAYGYVSKARASEDLVQAIKGGA
jgi:DNA-binding NarL/FixJ family response regulator